MTSLATYSPTPADRALITEARLAFRVDFRYLEAVLKARHQVARSRLVGQSVSPRVLMVKALRALDPRLIPYVDLSPGGCWVWTGGLTGSGQPAFRLGPERKVQQVRRWLYVALVGPIPAKREALSAEGCEALCVRPEHVLVLAEGWRTRHKRLSQPKV